MDIEETPHVPMPILLAFMSRPSKYITAASNDGHRTAQKCTAATVECAVHVVIRQRYRGVATAGAFCQIHCRTIRVCSRTSKWVAELNIHTGVHMCVWAYVVG